MRRAVVIAFVLAGLLAGCGSSSSSTSAGSSGSSAGATGSAVAASSSSSGTAPGATSTTRPTASGPTSGACRKVPAPAPKGPQHLAAPAAHLDPARTYRVTVSTNCGTFAFDLDVKDAPKTTASFYYLVRRGFFDGLTFHRVAAGFVIQGGDPLGDGTGGPGYTIVEPPPRATDYTRGTVAMAKGGAEPSGASGSQFFIVTAATAGLPPDYALVGHVVSGQSVVQGIGALPTNPPQDGMPLIPVVMSRVTVSAG